VTASVVVLDEWGPRITLELTSAERRVVARYKNVVRCDEASRANLYRIRPVGGRVGSVRLSERTVLSIRPKLPIAAFGALISLAYETALPPFSSEQASLDIGPPSTWFYAHYLNEVRRLVRLGLRSDYREERAAVRFIRGRLEFRVPNPGISGRTRCVFAEFDRNHA
jgi:hypothetical protein